jgi:hypothetical protein
MKYKKEIEEGKEEDKIKNWYGITSIGQQMESIKAILKWEDFNIFRKGGVKLEWTVKNKDLKKIELQVKVRKD